MILYNGKYLCVAYEAENNRFVNSWNLSPTTEMAFKSELLQYLKCLKKINPTQILWLNTNFGFQINDATKIWVEKNILMPRHKSSFVVPNEKGYHLMAFVVGTDVLSQMEVMDLFDKPNLSVFNPKYFATEQEARNWLNGDFTEYLENPDIKIIYKGLNEDGLATFEITKSPKDISRTLKLFKTMVEENDFIKSNLDRFSKLTLKEKEVMSLIAKGLKHQEAAEEMKISIHTVRDHLKSIKSKLQIVSNAELHTFNAAFLK